jgi:large subunit ribosomal protein L25
MTTLTAKIRTEKGRKLNTLRDSGRIPAVVYGNKVESALIDIDYKDFQRTFKESGESSLVTLKIDGEKADRLVLVHEMQRDHVSDKVTHIDFFQPNLKEEVEVEVPLVIEGEAPAVKDFGGTLVKNISDLKIKALPQSLPHEIIVNVEGLKTLEDNIQAKDIKLPAGVTLDIEPDQIVISIAAQTNVEEELAQEITENVEDVEKVEKPEKEEVVEGEEPAAEAK